MDEARRVLERLDRIDEMRRGRAKPDALLGEVRALLLEAEAWVHSEPGAAGAEQALGRVRDAVLDGERVAKRTLVA